MQHREGKLSTIFFLTQLYLRGTCTVHVRLGLIIPRLRTPCQPPSIPNPATPDRHPWTTRISDLSFTEITKSNVSFVRILRGGGVGRFDFQKFCLIFAPSVSIILFCIKKTWKKYHIFKLKTVWMQNEQFYYEKSWICGHFGNFTIQNDTLCVQTVFNFWSWSSSRPFRYKIRWLRPQEQKSRKISENRIALGGGIWRWEGRGLMLSLALWSTSTSLYHNLEKEVSPSSAMFVCAAACCCYLQENLIRL